MRMYAVGGLAVTAFWLQIPQLPGSEPQAPPPQQDAGAAATPPPVHCDRTLRPRGRVTINRAVHARRYVRTICLRKGRYRTGTVWLRRDGQTITSYPGERAVWRGRIVVRANNVTLRNLTLDGSRGRRSLPSPTISSTGFTLRDSDVTNRTGICVHPTPYKRLTPRRFTIERNRIHGCGHRPPANYDHGVYVAAGDGLIRWNAIFDNADRGVQLYPAARGVRVTENTIDGNGEGVLYGEGATGNVVSNNLITNSNVRFNVEHFELHGGGNALASNCVRAGGSSDYYNRDGGIAPDLERYVRVSDNEEADVRYVNRARKDFRVASAPAACSGMGAPDDVAAP
jgi:hypothetical protein